jgi:hypothetical protein
MMEVQMRWTKMIPVFAFPVLLSLGILLIPVVPDYADHALAERATARTGRWFAGHILSAVAFGVGVWAAGAIVNELERRDSPARPWVLPAMAIGSGLYAAGLGADGIGPLAVAAAAGSPVLFFDGSGWWVTGVFMAGTLFFGGGQIFLVGHAIEAGLVVGVWRYVTLSSALLFAAAPAIQSGWALYGVALASIGVFVPLGLSLRHSG